jgi:tRNA(Ile)-lysidine synthase
LQEINPNLEETFQRNFKRLSRLDAFVQEQIESIWKSWVIPDGKGFRLHISGLLENKFTDVVLSYKLQPLGFSLSQIQDLVTALESQPGVVFSSKDYKIHVDRTEIFIQPKRFFTIPNQYAITEFMGEISKPISLKFKDYHTENLAFSSRKEIAYFDFDKLKFPLTLRQWEKGDRIHPFGMKGVKKVSDLLIDAKVPLHEKENVWVLESHNQICWVIGYRSSELYKVDENTTHVYVVEKT